ncbi:unnamed protein product [Sphenostylis stenocarpa]|uniref:Uncharacterized protein n=1 Tax=Sphenostylis stenocarpa TaxID=92480 RepID=A0AA87BCF1_9FABA|nr:unnamed protein product [Sphenostylis stenocarpa]
MGLFETLHEINTGFLKPAKLQSGKGFHIAKTEADILVLMLVILMFDICTHKLLDDCDHEISSGKFEWFARTSEGV